MYIEAPEASSADDHFVYMSVDYDEWRPETFRGFVVEVWAGKGADQRQIARESFQTLPEAEVFAARYSDRYHKSSSVDDYAADLRRAQAAGART